MARKPKPPGPSSQLDLFGQKPPAARPEPPAARPEPPAARPEPAEERPDSEPGGVLIPIRRAPAVHPERAKRVEASAVPPPSPPQNIGLPEGWRLEKNLAAFAGAGSGKTYGLVTCALHLLAGARSNKEPIEPARLCMLTFTEKAAGEMRERLLERLEALADGTGEEADLRQSFAALGRPFPPASFFRQVRDELGAAFIGTFHALCMQLLKQAPPGLAGMPGFTLLDERTARALMDDVAVRLVLERVEAKDPAVATLVRDRGFASVVATLIRIWRKAREEGTALEVLAVGNPAAARRAFDDQLDAVSNIAAALVEELKFSNAKNRDQLRDAAARCNAILKRATFENFAQSLDALKEVRGEVDARTVLKRVYYAVMSERKDKRVGLDAFYGAARAALQEAALRGLMVELTQRYEARLGELDALDFTGLLLRARGLLRDHPEARVEAQARVAALLVDEFQDTNGVQLDLVHLLAEERTQGPRTIADRATSAETRAVPVEPAFLCIVGDRKQGIYEFRGADVSLMEEAASTLERSATGPGARAWLKTSRRSTPALVKFANAVSAELLGAPDDEGPGFEVHFDPEHDALVPHRPEGPLPRPVLALKQDFAEEIDAEGLRKADARAVAKAVAWLLDDATPRVVDQKTGKARRVEARDVAVLFSKFTSVQLYEQALVLNGVRHRVVRGRGFFGAQEIVDLASLLALLANPGDAVSLAAVLRSPLVGLADASLLLMADALGDRLDGARLLDASRNFALPGDDGEKFETFRALYARLRAERHRLKVADLLQVVFAETGFEERVAAAPHGEQALGNLEKLLVIARAADERGAGGCAALARELLELAQTEPTEAQGEVVEQGDAVTLCTIHQAKGLEWPVVVLADLPAFPQAPSGWAELDRDRGLAVRPAAEGEAELDSIRFVALRDVARARDAAERKRLLYVALTRPRDLLVLGLRKGVPRLAATTPAKMLEAPLGGFATAPFIEELDVDTLKKPWGRHPEVTPPEAQERLDRAVARAEAPAPLAPVAMVPVTQLQDFVSCPRRYHYAHQLGLSETPLAFDWAEGDEAAAHDPRAQGIAAHKVLERTPLSLLGQPGLKKALLAIAEEDALPAPGAIVEHAIAFWDSDFGQQVGKADPAAVFRELPFVLKIGKPGQQGLVLRGQIDLLLLDAEGAAHVLDYKTVHRAPAGAEPYSFQLSAYALAARKFAPTARVVKTGIAYLRDRPVKFDWETPAPDALDSQEGALQKHTGALLEAQREGRWEGRSVERCRALKCGYISRCHPQQS